VSPVSKAQAIVVNIFNADHLAGKDGAEVSIAA
jgi:hypothetical protein